MQGPGEYRPDPTESITRLEDLPKPTIVSVERSPLQWSCPVCRHPAYRDRRAHRTIHDVGDLISGKPRDIHLTYSWHFCTFCRGYCKADTEDLAPPKAQYTWRVIALAVRLAVEDGLPYRTASWHLWRDHRVFVPFTTIQNWVEASGKKRSRAG